MTYTDDDIAKPILTTDSNYTPYRLRLTEGLHLKDDDWKLASVANGEQGTWPRVEGKLIVVGDCKHTLQEIEILLGTLDNNPGRFVLWLRCTHPPTFLPKGQIVAQIIPAWEHPEDSIPTACPVHNIAETKPQVVCELSVGGEALNITGLLDTWADLTIFPAKHWLSHWALENVAGHMQGIGGMQLAKQSKSVVQIKGPKGQLASLRPFVLDYKEPLLGRDLMAQWGVTIDIPDPSQDFWVGAAEERPTRKLNWKTDSPVWVEQWPLSKQKLKVLEELVEELLAKGHFVETSSPWNSPVFVIQKPGKDKWRLLQDLRQINNVIEDMGSLQPGMPFPTMLSQNWKLAVIDTKDCFFQIPLHPDNDPRFAFSVPTINREALRKRYHWRVLPQGLKVLPVICQWYVASLLSPVRVAAEKAIIHHYRDDVLVCAPTNDVLSHSLDLTINALVVAGFELQEDKVQRMPPWLGVISVLMEPVQCRSPVPRKLYLLLSILLLASLAAPVSGWLVPQSKANVWVTLTRAMGQDHICLSATSADNPLMSCLVGIPNGPKELPSKLLEITEQTNRQGASKGQSGQERSYQFVYQTKDVYTAKIQCGQIAHVEMASTTDRKPLALPKGVFLICGDRAWAGIPPHLVGGPCTFGWLGLFSPNKTTLMNCQQKNSTSKKVQKRDLASLIANCDSEIIHWSKVKGVAVTVFLPWVSIAKALGTLAHLECWVAKQANLTSYALAGLLSDEEITRQATLQNPAAIDYFLLLHGHRCEEFEGLCCFNLSTKAEDVHKAIQSIQGMVDDIKKETGDWLSGMFGNWGILGWVGSIIKSVLLVLFIIVLILVMIGIVKRMLNRLISSTIHSPSVNQVAIPSVPEWEGGMELEEDSEEDRNLEEEPQMEWPTQLEWFAEAYPDSEYRPPPFQFSSS
ncbi:hypothetical protein DUI87_12813 [Hirundo rustica rustica]|uniref:ribonuclease H n=1 Tax=Hirundo rustica rustica TaxID=333673 RepID=A0A3M0KA05_HIRRU|nr:hypothetical protein DUI87_12813 [Hirundo rustica rustica]